MKLIYLTFQPHHNRVSSLNRFDDTSLKTEVGSIFAVHAAENRDVRGVFKKLFKKN